MFNTFPTLALQYQQAQTVRNGASSHEIVYVAQIWECASLVKKLGQFVSKLVDCAYWWRCIRKVLQSTKLPCLVLVQNRLLTNRCQDSWWIRQLPDFNLTATWFYHGGCLSDQAAAWWIRQLPDWSSSCQIEIGQLPDPSGTRFVRSLVCRRTRQGLALLIAERSWCNSTNRHNSPVFSKLPYFQSIGPLGRCFL